MSFLRVLLDPRVAVVVFVVYCIAYLLFLDEEGAFQAGFLQFGPSSTTKFMNIPIDTWKKCALLYAVSFLSSIMTGYYGTSLGANFDQRLQDPDLELPFGLGTTMAVSLADASIQFIMNIISIMVITTQQLQFMVPGLLGDLLMTSVEAWYLFAEKSV